MARLLLKAICLDEQTMAIVVQFFYRYMEHFLLDYYNKSLSNNQDVLAIFLYHETNQKTNMILDVHILHVWREINLLRNVDRWIVILYVILANWERLVQLKSQCRYSQMLPQFLI